MKKIILIIILFFGIFPALQKGRISLVHLASVYADDIGAEDSNTSPDLYGMNIVGSHVNSNGERVYDLADGTLYNPKYGNLNEVQITAEKTQTVQEYPAIFVPDMPQSDPGIYPTMEDMVNFIMIAQEQPSPPPPPTPKKDPCQVAKELVNALNAALAASQEVQARMNELKGFKDSQVEHGFLITRDASGFHATEMVEGNEKSVDFSYPAGTNVIFILHVHPPNASAAPSSTDILGLDHYGAGFMGNIIIHGDDMYLISVTNSVAYNKFVVKSKSDGYYDKNESNGWKYKSAIYNEFVSFSTDYMALYKNVDATYPTQLHLMDSYNMGVTLQKWNTTTNKFEPQEINTQLDDNTGSSSSITMGGTPIISKYKTIEVNKKDCPN